MTKKELVIFDMDGLLIDTERLNMQCWERALVECEVGLDAQHIKQMVGLGSEQFKTMMIELLGNEDDFQRVRSYREKILWEHIDQKGVSIKRGALPLLMHLNAKGIQTALGTSTNKARARRFLSAAKLDFAFDYEVFGDCVAQTKPSPDIFNRIVEMAKVDKNACVILEDSLNGVLAANAANIDVIWIEDMTDLRQNTKIKLLADFDSLHSATPLLIQLTKSA
jgi:HAD superfamily hydrolase (TIGR01509 family)